MRADSRTMQRAKMTKHGLPLSFNGRRHFRCPPELLRKIKAALVRIGNDGSREGFVFAKKMFAVFPGLRGV